MQDAEVPDASGGRMPRTDSGSAQPSDPQTRGRSNTRAKLVAAAARLFLERGTADVSIEEICAAAGFTRGAFYSNYDTSTALFFEVYEQHTTEFLDRLVMAPPAADHFESAEEASAALIAAIPNEAPWYLLRASFAARSVDDPEIAAKLRYHGERLRAGIAPFIKATAQLAGRELVGNPADAVRVIIAAHVGAVVQAPMVDDPERLRRESVTAALIGVTREITDRVAV